MEESVFTQKKEKILNWLKDPLNLTLVAVLVFAFAIRLYYFILTSSQPLWWDEAAYGSMAKNWIMHIWDNTTLITIEMLIRPPLFSLIWAALLKLGISETPIKFIMEFLPSFFSVVFVYLISKEVIGKRGAIISTFIFSVLWIHLFYTLRFLTSVPSLLFFFSSIYFFILAVKHKFNYKFFVLSLFLLSLSTLMRYPNGLLFFSYILVLIISKQFFITKLKFIGCSIIGVTPIWIFFIINLITKGNIFPAVFSGIYLGKEIVVAKPLTFSIFNFIKYYLSPQSTTPLLSIFLIFFLIGFVVMLFNVILASNLINKSSKMKNYLLLLMILIIFYAFFFFYIRGAEDRYLFPISISLCCIAAFGINSSYDLLKKYNKLLAIFFLFAILLVGGYSQIQFADGMIENKKTSYLQIRQGFEWIKDNLPEDAVLTGNQIHAYSVYYAERKHLDNIPQANETELLDQADFLILHLFVPMPDYIQGYLQENQDKWVPINAWFFDSEKTQPALIIYARQG